MDTRKIPKSIAYKVGVFTAASLVLIAAFSVYVNDRPFWWRPCQLVYIHVEDATGLKTKSPVRSLGLQIGFLHSVSLSETQVKLGICITAPVEVLPETRAYIRGEGFLGDKFVELKPVRYLKSSPQASFEIPFEKLLGISSAYAADAEMAREVPVGRRNADMDRLIENADELMKELTVLARNLKDAIDPEELRSTIRQLNKTLENAAKMLAPEGGLTAGARRSMERLEEAFDQMRQQMTRINKGEGSLGKILNDPVYAEELMKALRNLNKLLDKTADIRFVISAGGEQIPAYDGGRGFFQLGIWPTKTRYYLVGVSSDPRGRFVARNTTTEAGGQTTTVRTVETQEGGLVITAMLGKLFYERVDLSFGALHGDGAGSMALYLGPTGIENTLQFRTDIYARGRGIKTNARFSAIIRPLPFHNVVSGVFLKAGVDGINKVNGGIPYFFGAGVTFDDQDIKLLFTLL